MLSENVIKSSEIINGNTYTTLTYQVNKLKFIEYLTEQNQNVFRIIYLDQLSAQKLVN